MMHVTKTPTASSICSVYHNHVVQKHLGQILETKVTCGDDEALDAFFEKSASVSSLIVIVKLELIVEKSKMDIAERAMLRSKYPF